VLGPPPTRRTRNRHGAPILSTGTIAVGALCAGRSACQPGACSATHAYLDPRGQFRLGAAAAIPQDPGPHERQIYELFGAQELDWYAIATKVQGILGISVRHEPVEISTMVTALPAVWNPKRVHQEITGSRPTTVEDHAAATRATFDTDGQLAITDARLSAN
jgi:hypothetical protein